MTYVIIVCVLLMRIEDAETQRKNLTILMKRYRLWGQSLVPQLSFDQFLVSLEKLASKREFKDRVDAMINTGVPFSTKLDVDDDDNAPAPMDDQDAPGSQDQASADSQHNIFMSSQDANSSSQIFGPPPPGARAAAEISDDDDGHHDSHPPAPVSTGRRGPIVVMSPAGNKAKNSTPATSSQTVDGPPPPAARAAAAISDNDNQFDPSMIDEDELIEKSITSNPASHDADQDLDELERIAADNLSD